MKYKKSFIFICLIICLFSIASITAGDVNDNAIASENTGQIELSTNNEITGDNLQTSEENTTLTQTNNDESISAEFDLQTLSVGEGTYEDLKTEIGDGGDKNLAKSYYHYTGGDAIEITTSGIINGNGAVIDMARSNIRAFMVSACDVTIKNLTIKNANYSEGGAIYFNSSGAVENCNFINNSALDCGGAIYMCSGTITNCNFTNNKSPGYYSRGGAIMGSGTVTNCNFVNNTVSNGDGGTIYMYSATIENCNFIYNMAYNYGGTVYMNSGTVENCNFVNNTAGGAGAVYIEGNGTLTNCNFTDNSASSCGGAIYIHSGAVENCNFTDNAANDGGAVYIEGNGTVTICNFVNNAAGGAGAVFMYFGTVENCNFTNNQVTSGSGGAVYILEQGTVSICNFVNNTAGRWGGAIYMYSGTVESCNFTNNINYGWGSAIYIYYGTVESCNFTNNQVTSGSGGAVCLNGNGEVKNCNFTNNIGGAVYFLEQGNVSNSNFANNSASHASAIYFEFEHGGTVSNCNFTNNSGGTIRMGSGSVENCNFTNNQAASNRWGAVYFDSSGEVTNCNFVNNIAGGCGGAVYFAFGSDGTVTNCNFVNNTASGGGAISTPSSTVENCNFVNNIADEGGAILVTVEICNVTNCNFTNNQATSGIGGAVYFNSGGNVTKCNFINNTASIDGGAIRFTGTGTLTYSNFINNTASCDGAVCFLQNGEVTNCNFTNNAASRGGAVFFWLNSNYNVTNCNFVNNTASGDGGAVYSLLGVNDAVTNCSFVNNTAFGLGGAIYVHAEFCNVTNCNFTNNQAPFGSGGAVYFKGNGEVTNCNFINNQVTSGEGGALYFPLGTVTNCNFLMNKNTFSDYNDAKFDNCWYWFGNNASNYETKHYSYINSWLFLDAASSPLDRVEGKSSIVFNLKLYDSASKLITTPDIPNLPDMIFDLSATNGYLSKNSTHLGETVIFTSTSNKEGNVNASYCGASCSVTITSLNLEAPDVSKYYNGSERFIVTLSDSAHKPVSNKNVSITIDGKTTTGVTDGSGQFSIPLDLNPGNYIVNSTCEGLEVISNVNISSTVDLGNVKGTYKDVAFDAAILDSAGKPANGKDVEIKVGNLNLTAISDSNGVVSVSPDLDAGSYVMTVTNPVTGEVKSSDVVISKAISTTAISSETFPNGVTLTANVLPGNISGEVVFTINGNQDYSEDVADSKASITLRNLDSGKYTAVVTFNGNSNYNASTSSQITFDIDEYDYVISAPDVTKYYGEPEKFNITLTKNNVPVVNANVKITLNDVDYTKNTDKNGKISMNISDLNVGVYDVVVKYNSITVNSVITVNQASTKISGSASKLTTVYNGNKNLIATLVDSTGNPIVGAKVTIKLSNGNTQTPTTDSNGQVKLSANGLAPVKTYTATVTFAGNANYKKSIATAKITVNKATPKLTAKAKTFKKTDKTKKYTVTLKTNQNKVMKNTKVTIKVNKKTYSAKTNNKGIATFKITKLTKKGKYTATVTYKGSTYYNKLTKKVKITIK